MEGLLNIQSIQPDRLADQADCVILDVRTLAEHRQLKLKSRHVHVPLDELDPARFMAERGLTAGTPVLMLCHAGKRAAVAAARFQAAGFPNVRVIEGGITGCEACGLPLVRGAGGMSLERQVRIVAGAVVLLGVILGWTVNYNFYLLAAFVGAGLVFSGATGWCGMAMLLARAPWNR